MSSAANDREHFKAKQNNQILEARRSVISELNMADTNSNIAWLLGSQTNFLLWEVNSTRFADWNSEMSESFIIPCGPSRFGQTGELNTLLFVQLYWAAHSTVSPAELRAHVQLVSRLIACKQIKSSKSRKQNCLNTDQRHQLGAYKTKTEDRRPPLFSDVLTWKVTKSCKTRLLG